MKLIVKLLIVVIVFLLGFGPVEAATGINRKINFQGKVVNKGIGSTDGTNVTDGNYNFTFSLWDTLSAGTSIWSEVWNSGSTQVSVNSGIFQVALGAITNFPPTIDFNSDSLYVSVNFNGDGDMSPRIQMAAVPYAFNAEKVGGLTVTNTTGTLTIPNGTDISFGGSFTTMGVGISLNQNLNTESVVNFAGLSLSGDINLNSGSTYRIGGTQVLNMNSPIGSLYVGGGGTSISSGTYNTSVGTKTLSAVTTGSFNVAFGWGALAKNATGSNNFAIGYGSLGNLDGSTDNFGFGLGAGNRLTSGSENMFLGSYAGYGTASYSGSDRNTILGYYAGYNINSNADNNTIIGYNAGYNIGAGSSNVFIGHQAGYYETGSNKLIIANNGETPIIYGNFANGNVGIGTTNPLSKLSINGSTSIASGKIADITGQLNLNDKYGANIGLNVNSTVSTSPGALGTAYGIFNVLTDANNPNTIDVYYRYGQYNSVNVTGDTSSTKNVYGIRSLVTNTNGSDQGTRVTYGGYFTSQGHTNGVSTSYGLYTSSIGADKNYGLYSAAGVNYFAGNVGIGNSSPLYKLDITGDALISDRLGIGSTDVNFALHVGTSAVGFDGNLSVGGTVTFSNIPLGTGTTILYIDSSGNLAQGTMPSGGTTYTATNGLNLNGSVIGLGGTMAQNTLLDMLTYNLSLGINSTSPTLYAGANGLVGIGTSNPGDQLHIFDAVRRPGVIIESGSGSDDLNTIVFRSTFTGTTYSGSISTSWYSGGYMKFLAPRDAVNPGYGFRFVSNNGIDRMNINTGSGNVGIGTTDPKYKLEIIGSLLATNIGIGATTDSYELSVAGDEYVSQNLSIGGSLNVTGNIAVGGTIAFTNVPVGTGTTILYINSSGVLVQGTLPPGGSAYTASNGLNLNGSVFGLGGTLNYPDVTITDIGIGTSGYLIRGLGGTQALFINQYGAVSIGITEMIRTSGLYVVTNTNIAGGINTQNYLGDGRIEAQSDIDISLIAYSGYGPLAGSVELETDEAYGSLGMRAIPNIPLIFYNNNLERMRIAVGGSVGIGTSNPGFSLDVVGDGRFTGNFFVDGQNVQFNQLGALTGIGTSMLYIDSGGNLYSGTLPPGGASYTAKNGIKISSNVISLGGTLTEATQIGTSNFGLSFLGQGNSQAMFIGTSGYVGIGTTNPQVKLEINSALAGNTGLRFTQVNTSTAAGTTNNKVLTVDDNGNVYLTADQTGSGSLPSGTINGQTLRFDIGTSSFVTNSNMLVAANGSISVRGSSSDDVKTTSGTGSLTDFEGVGVTMINVGSTNNVLSIDSGTFPDYPASKGVFSTTGISTTWPVGIGSQVILRDDGKYLILGGGTTSAGGIGIGSSAASLWDGVGTTMSLMRVAIGATGPGDGSIALKRHDGRYLLVHGNYSGYTSVFDPYNRTAVVAGPPAFGGVAVQAGPGTNAFQRWDGKYVVIGGGTTAWGMYDPGVGATGTFIGGSGVSTNFGAGAHFLMRDDGNFIVFQGVGDSNYWFYSGVGNTSAGRMILNAGGMTAPQLTANAFSIRMNNGKFLVLDGGTTNTSWIYDENAANYGSLTKYIGSGLGVGDTLGEGATTIFRQDGKYLLFVGAGSTNTYILDPSQDQGVSFVSVGPSLPAAPGVGMVPFMGADGKYYYSRGGIGSAKLIDKYDMGLVIGGGGTMVGGVGSTVAYYESEPINTGGNLNLTSSLSWNAGSEGTIQFFARVGTGLAGVQAANYKPILKSGDILGVGDSGNDYVQVRIVMKRDLPKFLDQEWGVRKANQTRYRRINRDPAVYDYTIDNSAAVHRSQFDFGGSVDDSGPVQVNLINDRDKNLGLSLATFQNAGGLSHASSSVYYGSFALSNGFPFSVGSSQSTIVMKKQNGNYAVAIGQTASVVFDYDPVTQNFSVGTTLPYKLGVGALAFKRPDGKYFVVIGDGTSLTALYDPVLDTYSTETPTLTGNVGRGAMVMQLPNGKVVIFHGNFTPTSSIYDPFANTAVEGPQSTRGIGNGSLNIPRPDGSFFMALGTPFGEGCTIATAQNTTNIFNPYTMTIGASSPAISATSLRSIGPGSLAIPRADGNWMIVLGAGTSSGTGVAGGCVTANNTMLYNPIMNKIVVGPNLSANAGLGANVVPRGDGTWLVMHGGNLATSSIYIEGAGVMTADIGLGGTFVAGPVSNGNIGGTIATTAGGANGGSVAFQRDDGKFMVILGAGGSGVRQLDALWVDKGIYKSEQMYLPDLDTNSILTWKATPYLGISAEVKTSLTKNGLQSAPAREIATPGEQINPLTGEKWVSLAFNFRRVFPSYGGLSTDVWYNGGSINTVSRRTISTPMLSEFSVTKDINLIDLKTDGLSVFRVSSNGNVYTANNGVVNSGGADLAENYSSAQDLQKGEVVSIDPKNNHAVQRSQYQYQPDLMGVVSSDPGFVAGAYTKDSFPIALVGRVPVKVSTENGNIRVGDRLTSSSIAGIAMKATKSGRVLGTALESINNYSLSDCPISNFGNKGQRCTTVMTFVNLTDYLGSSVEEVMAESNKSIGASVPFWADKNDEKILQFLADSKNDTNAQKMSDIFADRVVSTKIVADTIVANSIKAKSIEGLDIFTDKIGSLSQKYTDLKNEMDIKNASDSAILSVTPTKTSDFLISSNFVVKALSEFWDKVLFKGEVIFEKTPTFGGEMAGFAVINSGDDRVNIDFDQEYKGSPVVNATMIVENDDEKVILEQNYVYFVAKKDNRGFTIVLNKKATTDIKFAWSALSIKEAKTFKKDIVSITPAPTTLIPTFKLIEATYSGLATESSEASSSATIGL